MNAEPGDLIRRRTPRVRRWLWMVLAVLLAWPMLGPVTGHGADVPAGDADLLPTTAGISVRDNFFEPSTIEIAPGATVAWTWEGIAPHNIVSTEFEAPVQKSGAFSFAFASPGTYDFVCTLHRGMHGRVVVAETPD